MPLYYLSGEAMCAEDRVRYRGEVREIEFVSDCATPDPETEWAVRRSSAQAR